MNNDEEFEPNEDEIHDDFVGVYVLDDDSHALVEVAVGMIHMLSHTQVDEEARINCMAIADEIAERFGINAEAIDVERLELSDGEVVYKPLGGVMGDEDIPEAEGPAVDPEEPQSG